MQEMKYFNEGNDCDICKNQLMTGRDGTVEDCRRRQNGLSCRFEERDIRTCPVCEHEVDREDMYFTKDCHGIPFRLVCTRLEVNMGNETVTIWIEEDAFEIVVKGLTEEEKESLKEVVDKEIRRIKYRRHKAETSNLRYVIDLNS